MPKPRCETEGSTSMKLSQAMREQETTTAAPKCVLVVEDELLIRMMVSEELRDCGYQVIEAADADEALVILEACPPDLVISDVKMPGSLDGLGLLAAAKRSLPTLPVILVSAHLEAAEAMEEGAALFIPKPFSLGVIVDAVRDELAKST